jgi:hypothetical protein
MSEVEFEVKHRKGALPAKSKRGKLAFNDGGVVYRGDEGQQWSWPWAEASVDFDPPGRDIGRTSSFVARGIVGLVLPSNNGVVVVRSAGLEVFFELASRDSTPQIMAQWVINAAPASVGHVTIAAKPFG